MLNYKLITAEPAGQADGDTAVVTEKCLLGPPAQRRRLPLRSARLRRPERGEAEEAFGSARSAAAALLAALASAAGTHAQVPAAVLARILRGRAEVVAAIAAQARGDHADVDVGQRREGAARSGWAGVERACGRGGDLAERIDRAADLHRRLLELLTPLLDDATLYLVTGFRTLEDSQRVEFDVAQGRKGPQAEGVRVVG